jgi:hypothetical protein
MKLEFCQQILEKEAQIFSFIKVRPVGRQMFHEDRQMDMKLIVAFRNFANASKN